MNTSSSSSFKLLLCLFLTATTISTTSSPPLPTANITLHGAAHLLNHTIHLTHPHPCPPSPSPSPSPISGAAIYPRPIRFLDPSTNCTASFSSFFSFSISRNTSLLCSPGDGLTFLILSNPNSFPSDSQSPLGLPDFPLSSKDSFIAVEFDTNLDSSHRDTNANHVGVDINSPISFAYKRSKQINLGGGSHIAAWIEYIDPEKRIRVWLSYQPVNAKPSIPVLDAPIDLSKHLREFMHVGFSASNGRFGSAAHIVNEWRFKTFGLRNSTPTATKTRVEDDDSGPQQEPIDHRHRFFNFLGAKISERSVGLILGGSVGIVFSVIVIAVTITCYAMRNKRRTRRSYGKIGWGEIHHAPTRISLSEIKCATERFSRERIIGEGASATVYLGFLLDGKRVAVKRFNQETRIDGFINPFTTEFATMARCLRHRNLVQLIGWCCERKELVLVYEYLPNGSLDQILHGSLKSVVSLTWEQRMRIILGTASALSYLHEECDRQIIHRDVKSCNILLSADFTPKLSDFGLAKVYEHSVDSRQATLPAGTVGYLAPEYVHSGVPTVKTDVYSFGVVILEVASGRKSVNEDGLIADWIWELWEKRKLMDAVDVKLMGRYSKVDMERVLKVGMCCAHPNCDKRPTVREVAMMLQDKEALPVLPAKKPVVKLRSLASADDLSDTSDSCYLIHALDDTPWLTPRSQFV